MKSKERTSKEEGEESESSRESRMTPENARRPTILLLDDPELV